HQVDQPPWAVQLGREQVEVRVGVGGDVSAVEAVPGPQGGAEGGAVVGGAQVDQDRGGEGVGHAQGQGAGADVGGRVDGRFGDLVAGAAQRGRYRAAGLGGRVVELGEVGVQGGVAGGGTQDVEGEDVGGAFPDRQDLGVAEQAGDAGVLDVAGAAEAFDVLAGRGHREAAGAELGQRGGQPQRGRGRRVAAFGPAEQGEAVPG